ncbi:MAG: ribonuclease R [Gammaproteobacteria bacterium]|nr:ribonuclease R [Gammaproteobacteria bacterium]
MPRKKDKKNLKDPYAKRESERYENPIPSREFILETLAAHAGPMTFERLQEKLQLSDPDSTEALYRRLGAMIRDGQIIKNRREGYIPVYEKDLISGRVIAHPDGFGFLTPDEGGDDIFLSGSEMRSLLHGDRAVIRIKGVDRRGRNEGALIEVIERANQTVVGRLAMESGAYFLMADNKRIHQDIIIPPDQLGGASTDQIVIAAITQQPTRRHPPLGKVIEVLGHHMMPGLEIDVALYAHNIPFKWPDDVNREAAKLGIEVAEADKQGRTDYRDKPFVTIDGEDARDFDDAVYAERTKSGWRLFVAIADVSHYVQPGSALDDEAARRGTSVYFPGRVVPMLPEIISNGLCSLNPHADRLALVCELSLNKAGKITRSTFKAGVICSHARLTYNEVAKILINKNKTLRKKHKALTPSLDTLYELYKVLQNVREKRGAIDFETVETRIEFGSEKKIETIVPVERNDAHKLIEECMILANIAAARFITRHKVPGLYRVHERPSERKVEELRQFLGERGLALEGDVIPNPEDYARLMHSIEQRADNKMIQTVLLRSLRQAIYSPKNEGHFGLALECYAHFTSPIRRYPDLLLHRAIHHILAGGRAKNFIYDSEQMAGLGENCSTYERRADEATWDVIAWLKCEYMRDRVGEVFPGIITSVTSFGLFVELDGIYTEGLAHITSLPKDYYRFEAVKHALIGERTGRRFYLGDAINVQIVRVDLDERKIDLEVITKPAKKRRSRKKH